MKTQNAQNNAIQILECPPGGVVFYRTDAKMLSRPKAEQIIAGLKTAFPQAGEIIIANVADEIVVKPPELEQMAAVFGLPKMSDNERVGHALMEVVRLKTFEARYGMTLEEARGAN